MFVFHNYGLTLPGYLISTVPWAYMGYVPTKDLGVVYLQFVFPTSGNTEPIKWSWIYAYHCHIMGGSPPPHNGENRAILTNR